MIRNAMFGLSLLALSTGSAFAGSSKHNAKPVVVADAKSAPAPAADTAAPADKAEKKEKKAKKGKTDKGAKTETEGAKEMAPAPAK